MVWLTHALVYSHTVLIIISKVGLILFPSSVCNRGAIHPAENGKKQNKQDIYLCQISDQIMSQGSLIYIVHFKNKAIYSALQDIKSNIKH